nr:hypothetical protein [Tanacetum cinerariifolium]
MNLNQAKSSIEEPEYSFSMRYEHFITTPVTKLNEVADSSDKNLVPILHEHEVTSDNKKSHVESNFVESLSNHDTLKFDHLDEISGPLMPIHIAEEERIWREHIEYISLMERLININPCPRPTVNAYTIVEEEIDIVTNTDELLPPGFENKDSEGEIDVVEVLHENEVTRPNKYSELSATKAIQAYCDVKAKNIIFQGLPPEVYAFVSNHKVAKELWERIQLLMQGTSLKKAERESLKDALRKLKGKALDDDAVTSHSIDLEMLNINVEPLNSRLLNNMPAHSDYLKHTLEEAAILKEIVEQGKLQNPLNAYVDSALEVHPRIVKTSLQNKNRIVEPKGTASVQHSTLNANSKLICVKCNGCMLYDNHDLCVLNVVTARVKSKFAKKNSKREVWKPTGKVFTNIGYTWRPIGRTFTIVGNAFPLTRITTTTEVPYRKLIVVEINTPRPVVTLVYSRKPRISKSTDPVSKSKIIKTIPANKKEPSQSWGSTVSNVPSSSLDECRLSKLLSGI